VIEVRNLTKRFGPLTAVDDLSLEVGESEVLGLLGPNGAGKTTTVRMLCCLISKTSGEARIAGYDTAKAAEALQIRRLVGFVSDNVGLYEELSAYENLDFYGRLYGCREPQRAQSIRRLLTMLGLWEKRDSAAGTFSKGMKQKLAMARALVHDPRVFFLDEPTANLDPESARTVRDFIVELKHDRRTIVLNTHNLAEAQRICDRIAILNTRLVATGTPEELERSVGRRRLLVRLDDIDRIRDAALAAVRAVLPAAEVSVEGDQLSIAADDPDAATPDVMQALIRAGARVRSAGVTGASLEDAYLNLVGRGR
jgi:ABC-2 type transport system ATP-binding protein